MAQSNPLIASQAAVAPLPCSDFCTPTDRTMERPTDRPTEQPQQRRRQQQQLFRFNRRRKFQLELQTQHVPGSCTHFSRIPVPVCLVAAAAELAVGVPVFKQTECHEHRIENGSHSNVWFSFPVTLGKLNAENSFV